MRKWENCVCNSLNVCIFAHCWYLNTLSFGWEAIVVDDYEAVMPYFSEGSKACLKFGMAWTSVYSKKVITSSLCKLFLDVLDRRFKKVDLVFDKHFVMPDSDFRGLFFKEHVYQIDTITPPRNVKTGDEFLKVLKEEYPKSFNDNIKFREYSPKNIDALRYENFVELDGNLNVRPALKLKTLSERAVRKKFGYYMEISVTDSKLNGAILVTYGDGYIFVPFLKCKGVDESFAQYTMLLDMVLRHFAYTPGILVLDYNRLGISPEVAQKLGVQVFDICRYKVNMMVGLRKFFRNKLLKKCNNTI